MLFPPQAPAEVVVVRNKDHVVCIDRSEGGEPVTHDCEEGNEDVIDDIDNVLFSRADGDPAD